MSVTSIRKRTADRMGEGKGEGGDSGPRNLQCHRCGTPTAYDELSTYGAQCFPCYAAYCREERATPDRSILAKAMRAEISSFGRPLPL